MERLARPLEELKEHYDAVVIGSGYGGSIAACRLSRAGQKVALLERGREMLPGEYPTTLIEAAGHVQTTGPALGAGEQKGDRRNLYWFHTDGPMNVFSGCGLGGTSLVNANVSLQPDAGVFGDARWPSGLRGDTGSLAHGYEAARAMLRPATYPATFPHLSKIDALGIAAGGRPVELTPINVTFHAGENPSGVFQQACVGCGDCVTGCNFAAKNTLLMNYLPDAAAHGAEIFCEVEVRTIERDGGGERWIVHAQPLGLGRVDAFHAPPLAITAEVIVLSAGALGSTEILLRSRAAGLPVSDRLGDRFTGNGDVLGFSERPDTVVRGVGAGHRPPNPTTPAGPCITAVIPDPPDGGESPTIIEDAVIPGLLTEVVAGELATQFGAQGESFTQRWSDRLSALVELVSGRHSGATDHLQTFLLMGQDDDEGRLVLRDDHVCIEWPGVDSTAFYQAADRVLERAAEQAGGTYIRNPLTSRLFHDSLITVHPLGGCVTADRAEDGVVDHRGRVFSSDQGETVYESLIVADGSIVPMPLGVNPLLTISALTERAMALLCAERGWEVEPSPAPARPPEPAAESSTPGLRFTERMSGWWGNDQSPDEGALASFVAVEARSQGDEAQRISFVLTLSSADIGAVVRHLDTPMEVVGTVEAPALSDQPLTVEHGAFQLLVADDPDPAVRHMRYHLPLAAVSGETFHLEGMKVIAPGEVGEVWGATSTLYATIRRDGPEGQLLGRGVLHIEPSDFARQLTTIQVLGAVGHFERLRIEADFAAAFAGPLVHDYGTVVHRTTSFNPDAPPRRHRALEVPPPRRYEYTTADGVSLRLTRYPGGNSAPVLLVHGMGNPLTWSLDTVEVTLLEYLVAHGYDVWLQEWRASTLLPTSLTQFNGDQVAQFDHPAAAALVASETGRSDLHVVAHCVGSITWTMATLRGWVDPSSLLCSAVSAHPIAPTITRLKVGMRLGEILHRMGIRMLTTGSFTNESFLERLFDRELRLYPIPKSEECDQAVCRRVAFIYGNAVHHLNLDPATHAALHELFGPTNMTMMDHLSAMARAGEIRDAGGARTYLTHLERLQRPVGFLSGALNLVWLPESTGRTFDLLVDRFGADNYRRTVIDGYGHQDVFDGAAAARDVFPAVLDHLRWVNA
jgi:cholesterol oxidase